MLRRQSAADRVGERVDTYRLMKNAERPEHLCICFDLMIGERDRKRRRGRGPVPAGPDPRTPSIPSDPVSVVDASRPIAVKSVLGGITPTTACLLYTSPSPR